MDMEGFLMTITEKTAYLKGLTDGLGIDPQTKEGKLWAALNDLLGDVAHEIEKLHETDLGQAQALDGVADELSYLEELCGGFDSEDEPACGGCSRACQSEDAADNYAGDDDYCGDLDEEDDEELNYDGVIYDATCPVCGEEISFDEETLLKGSIQCPQCGETLEFDLGEDESQAEPDAPETDTPDEK